MRVYYIGAVYNSLQGLIQRLGISELSVAKQMEWDPVDPQYVVVTEHIYTSPKHFREFCKYYKDGKNRVFIGILAEAISGDLNLFDYVISYNRKMQFGDRIFRIPTIFLHASDGFKNIYTFEQAKEELKKKTAFCNFIYSNKHSHPMRDTLFNCLSEYKRVDSLGRHLNNMNNIPDRESNDWKKNSIEQKRPYKFSIAAENALFEGYVSEKLITTFEAHSIPIYWGDPDVALEFNENAFVNVHSYKSEEDLLKRIKEIDEDDDIWCEMISQPFQTEVQYKKSLDEMQEYYAFIKSIFQEDSSISFRRARGTAQDNYFNFFSRAYRERPILFIKRTGRKIINLLHRIR